MARLAEGTSVFYVRLVASPLQGRTVAYSDAGIVKGPATAPVVADLAGAVDVLFHCGLISCRPTDVAVHPPPPLPLPGDYVIHEAVWYTGENDKTLKLENATRGEVCGPATSEKIAGQGVDVYFPSIERFVSMKPSQIRDSPPAASADALSTLAAARVERLRLGPRRCGAGADASRVAARSQCGATDGWCATEADASDAVTCTACVCRRCRACPRECAMHA